MSDAADVQRDLERAATEEDAVTTAVRDLLKNVHTALPGIIDGFNASEQTATVRLAIRRVWIDLGPRELPPCVDVPVHFPAGGGFVLTFPVAKGDECLVVFSERAIDNWFAAGGVQDPSEFRLHDYSDGCAFVGFASKPNAIPGLSTDGVELRTRDGTTVFRLESGTAYVGGKVGAEYGPRWETYRQAEESKNQTMLAALNAVNVAAQAMNANPVELAAFSALYPITKAFLVSLEVLLPIWIASLETFEASAPAYLAQKAKLF